MGLNGKRLASTKDFDESTGKLIEKKEDEILLLESKEAARLQDALKAGTFAVQSVEEKQFNQKPSIPFITSTLQQEASRKLGMGAR
ncbi:hypothetical protein EBR96_06725, partial [bacterium]|nr:hypothetical protein [bacterium]